jgi:hypothetical protein
VEVEKKREEVNHRLHRVGKMGCLYDPVTAGRDGSDLRMLSVTRRLRDTKNGPGREFGSSDLGIDPGPQNWPGVRIER